MEKISELEQQKRALSTKADTMHGQAITEPYLPKKREIQRERSKTLNKIMAIQEQIENIREKQAEEQIERLLKENRDLIFLSLNGIKTAIPENLEVELKFQPCKHKKRIQVKEFLRSYEFRENKKIPNTNTSLQIQWHQLLGTNAVIEGLLNCAKCKTQKESKLAKLRIWDNSPLGSIRWTLRKLQ